MMNKPCQDGTWLFLFHIYIGPQYQGCIEAKNTLQAMSQWAKRHGYSQDILRAEVSETQPPKKIVSKRKHADHHSTPRQ